MRIINLSLVFLVLILTGCQSPESPAAPVDLGAIKTEAVQTAMAEITVQAILNPSPTLQPLQSTPLPSATTSAELAGSGTDEALATAEVSPTATATPVPPVYACQIDKTQSLPEDGPQPAGAEIEKVWVIRNSGNVAWTSGNVNIKWVGGVNLCEKDCLEWEGVVNPGETIRLTVDLAVPKMPLDKMQIVQWGLVNSDKEIFCKLYYQIPYVY